MLGSDVCSVLKKAHDVRGYDAGDFDIADAGVTARVVKEWSPSVIVHTAAFTDVEACETERETAHLTNVLGTRNLAEASKKAGCLLVYMSTDYVFDGSKTGPYVESDKPNPINYYGTTKLEGENHVRQLAARSLIARTSWLFGPNGRNFVDTILKKASAGERLKVVDDQRGCPTYSWDLAEGLAMLIECGLEGTVHLTNSGEATWFELAECAIGLAGIEVDLEAVNSAAYPTRARRPANSVLASRVLEGAGIRRLRPWKDAVRNHLIRRRILRGEASS
jgi:dTDP-4-dehydrorhamnose reductase